MQAATQAVVQSAFLRLGEMNCTARPANLTANLHVVEESQISSTQAEQDRRQQFFAANGGIVIVFSVLGLNLSS